VEPQLKMDFMHILGQKEAIWNTIFSIFERRPGPPNVAGPGKTFPPLDGPSHRHRRRGGRGAFATQKFGKKYFSGKYRV